jgi:hypothetical protein
MTAQTQATPPRPRQLRVAPAEKRWSSRDTSQVNVSRPYEDAGARRTPGSNPRKPDVD